jgi:hypothetical protein
VACAHLSYRPSHSPCRFEFFIAVGAQRQSAVLSFDQSQQELEEHPPKWLMRHSRAQLGSFQPIGLGYNNGCTSPPWSLTQLSRRIMGHKRRARSVASDVSDTKDAPRTSRARTSAPATSASTQPDEPIIQVIDLDEQRWEEVTVQNFNSLVDSHQMDHGLQQMLLAAMDSWLIDRYGDEEVSQGFQLPS